jgi:hypothetical protein
MSKWMDARVNHLPRRQAVVVAEISEEPCQRARIEISCNVALHDEALAASCRLTLPFSLETSL